MAMEQPSSSEGRDDAITLARRYDSATEELWNDWRGVLRRDGVPEGDLCLDGPALTESYFSASPRLLFILREPNDCRGEELLALLRTEATWRAWRNVARWAAGIRLGFPPFPEVQRQSIQNEALRTIAAINIKKSSGGSSSNLDTIRDYAKMTDLQRRQLSLLKPEVVIACGTTDDLNAIIELKPSGNAEYRGVLNGGHSFRVIRWSHPSARGSVQTRYDNFRTAFEAGLQSTG